MQLTTIKCPEFPYLQYDGQNIYLSTENYEGIGCEYRKYQNLLLNKGRKRAYKPPI